MLPKKHRVSSGFFDNTKKPDFVLHSPTVSAQIYKTNEDAAKITFIVSKKVSPKAVLRNTIKRKLSATIEPYLPQLPPHTFIFNVRSSDTDVIQKDTQTLITKILS